MSHWAEIDSKNVVRRVIVGNNSHDDEGYEWIVSRLGGTWLKCSYNGNIRGAFPGIGWSYDEANDVFVAPVIEEAPEDGA